MAVARWIGSRTLGQLRRLGPHGWVTLVSYTILLLFILGLTAAGQQRRWPWNPPNWELLATLNHHDDGRPVHLNDVVFVDRQRGWIVGDRGGIWRTTNGGATWD